MPVVQLICDASSSPPWLASVLIIDGHTQYCDLGPTQEQLAFFTTRRDTQICGLELLSIALGLSTFSEQLKGRKVYIFRTIKELSQQQQRAVHAPLITPA